MAGEARVRLVVILLGAVLAFPARAESVQAIGAGEADELLGHSVLIAAKGGPPQDIGRVADVLVSATGQPMAAVLDVGGFMGVGNRKVAVTWSALRFAPAKDGFSITLLLAADRLRAAPDYHGPGKPVQAVGP